MRKHSQKLSVFILIALLIVALAVCLVACNPNGEQTDEHTTHTPDSTTEWHSDETDHWHLCVEGGEPLEKAQHDFVLRNDNEHHYLECTVCSKRKDVDGHTTVVKSDANGHWIECTKEGCSYRTQSTAHTLSTTATDDSDGEHHTFACTYDGCTYTEQKAHTLSYEHIAEGGHHQICAECDYVSAKEDCVKGADATFTDLKDGEHHTYVCAKCEATVTEEHTDLSGWRSDGENHYKVCNDCDAKLQNGAHTSKAMTTAEQHWTECEVCGEELTQRQNHTEVWKDSADHKQHYKGCEGCDYDFGQHADHVYEAWTANDGDETCSFTCSLCSLTITDVHDYEESADCSRCHYDPGKWIFGENDDGTYTLNQLPSFLSLFGNATSSDAPAEIHDLVLPRYYKGQLVTKVAGTADVAVFDAKGINCWYNLVIPEGYTEIGDIGSDGQKHLIDLYLPSTLTKIGDSLGSTDKGPDGKLYIADLEKYLGIEFAKNIGLPDEFYVKGEDGEYTKLTELVIPAGITELKSYSFDDIDSLDSVTFPTGFATVNTSAIPSRTGAIGALNFQSFTDYVKVEWKQTNPVSNGVELNIGGVQLPEDFTLDEGIESISRGTFGTVSNGVYTVYEAFKDVRKLRLPTSLTSAVITLPDVEEVYIPTLDQMFTIIQASSTFFEYLYGDNGLKVYVAGEELTSLTFDDTYTDENKAKYKYNNNDSLRSVTYTSANLTEITNAAFKNCKNLTSVDFGSNIKVINNAAFDSTGLSGEIKIPEGVATLSNAFANNADITALYIPSSVTKVDGGAFFGLTADIVFADGANVTSLSSVAFNSSATSTSTNSYMGKNIVLPAGSWKLAANMFKAGDEVGTCANLSRIYYQGTEEKFSTLLTQAEALEGVDAFKAANAYYYHAEDPGAGKNQLTWHYDSKGMFAAWDTTEPECDHHEFKMTPGEENHWLQCSKCSYKLQTEDHDTDGEIQSDEHDHWNTCSVCGGVSSQKTAHSSTTYDHDEHGHWGVCDTCGHTTSDSTPHTAKEGEYGSDDTTHWNICSVCEAKMEDTVTPHTPQEGTYKDGNADGHTYTCSVCSNEGKESHVYGDAGDGFKDGICTKCKFSQFTLDASGVINKYTAKDIEKLAIPSSIKGTEVKGIAAGTMSASIFADGCGLKSVKFPESEAFTKLGNYAFRNLTTLEYITLNQYVTTLGNQCFYGTGLLELELPDSVTNTGDRPLGNCKNLRKLVLGTGITSTKSLGSSWGDYTTVIVKGTLVKGSSAATAFFGVPTQATIYLYMDVDSWTTFCTEGLNSSTQNNVKNLHVFCKSDSDPAGKPTGDYADGYWKLSDEGEPELWTGQEIVVFKSTDIVFDIDSVEADEKTLDLGKYVWLQSCDITYSAVGNGVSVSSEGVLTATSFGVYQVKAVYGKDSTEILLTVRVRSTGIYAQGTVGGEEVSAQQEKLTLSKDTDKASKRSIQFKAGDKFKLVDGAFGIDKAYYPGEGEQQELVTFYDIEAALAGKVTVGEDNFITVTEDIWLTITLTFESTSSAHKNAIVVSIVESHYKVDIQVSGTGISNVSGTYTIVPGESNTLSLELKATAQITASASKRATLTITAFKVTLIDGTVVTYDSTQDHGVTLSGQKYATTSAANYWHVKTKGGLALEYSANSNISNGKRISTFVFTFNDDGTIASIEIKS